MKEINENSAEDQNKEDLKVPEGNEKESVKVSDQIDDKSKEEPQEEVIEASTPEEESVVSNGSEEKAEAIEETPAEAEPEVKAEAEEAEVTEDVKESTTPEEVKEEVAEEAEVPVTDAAQADTPEVTPSEETEKEEAVAEADQSENPEHEEEEEEHEEEEIDYTSYNKEELVKVIEEISKENDIKRSFAILKQIQPLFDEFVANERAEALKKFVDEGGVEDDFEYKHGELDNRFDASLRLIKDRKYNFQKNQEQVKQDNLELKNQILEELRHFVDSEETNTSIDALKDIQQRWKEVGMIPHAYVKTLWANYNALIDRFYDNRSIYFELKELDRKKNLTLKEELCEKAVALDKVESLNDAISQLNELHHDYKHIGPVPLEAQEELWQRFKAASDKIYAKRKQHIEEVKKELAHNLDLKKAVIDEVKPFAAFASDRINDWNAKTKEIIQVQKKWETIGGLPRDKAKEINKEFWGSFKSFFSNKNSFFKTLEGQREDNLKKKEELVAQAEQLKDSEDWDTTAQALKKIQAEWKEIGPVPQKQREEVFAKFKAACDHFFENRRAKSKTRDSEYQENYHKKDEICQELLKMAKEKLSDEEKLGELINHWNEIGFVPKRSIKEIQQKFFDALETYLKSSDLDEDAKEKWRITAKFSNLKGKPNADSRLNSKENNIRKQISQLESDISLWKNNLEFFAASKTAEKLKHDFDQKIEKAQDQLNHLKDELKIIRQM